MFSLFLYSSNLFSQSQNWWKIDGNSNGSSTSFIGTTNNFSLRFRANNTEWFSISPSGQYTFNGLNAIVLGSGVDNSTFLTNPFSNSLMVGFNSNIPTLFVGRSNGANTTGKVGIGTTYISNGYKLAVEGYIICEELVVRLRNDWPDYVFANNYDLLPLEERKAIVNKNKHLPGIKPADEICKEGMPVSETVKAITQNLEEHELYLYQLIDEIKQLKNETERLKMEINNK
jgi:hypothetical protein